MSLPPRSATRDMANTDVTTCRKVMHNIIFVYFLTPIDVKRVRYKGALQLCFDFRTNYDT